MANLATPNLPTRDMARSAAFYESLGFRVEYRDEHWMILKGHGCTLELFSYPNLDPATSSFGCCLRLDDVDAFYATCQRAGIAEATTGWPRLHPPRLESSGLRIGALIDPDCTLLRLVENPLSNPGEGRAHRPAM
jgi:catechol 2,3-dioxygenase-like lactoylglutathione lyase family enzyme